MKHNGTFVAAFVAFNVMMFSAAAFSQTAAARVNIPFDFSANHQALAAGCYTVELQSRSYIHLIDCKTGNVVGLMVSSANVRESDAMSSLFFQKTDAGMSLVQVRFALANVESELAVQPNPSLASNSKSPKVEIAMR